jgi:lipopolysaccharide export system protein LptC
LFVVRGLTKIVLDVHSGLTDLHVMVIAHAAMVTVHAQSATDLHVMVIAHAAKATALSAVLAHRSAMVTAQLEIQTDPAVTQTDQSAVTQATGLAVTQIAQIATLRRENTANLAPIQPQSLAIQRLHPMLQRSHS